MRPTPKCSRLSTTPQGEHCTGCGLHNQERQAAVALSMWHGILKRPLSILTADYFGAGVLYQARQGLSDSICGERALLTEIPIFILKVSKSDPNVRVQAHVVHRKTCLWDFQEKSLGASMSSNTIAAMCHDLIFLPYQSTLQQRCSSSKAANSWHCLLK